MNPKVSVIILNWNGYSDTSECLKSLENIDYPNYEIIIVDNGSTDDSLKMLKEEFPYITLLENEDNLGFAEGNNVGMRYALANGFDYVLLLNNDTTVESDFLTQLVNDSESDERIGIAGPKICYYSSPDRIWFAGGLMRKIGPFLRALYTGRGEPDDGRHDKKKEVDIVDGCAMLIKTSFLENIGMFDPDFFIMAECADLSLRGLKAGYRNIYSPSSKIYHKVNETVGRSFRPTVHYLSTRNWLWVLKRHFNLGDVLVFSVLVVGKIVFSALWWRNFPLATGYWNGLVDGILARPSPKYLVKRN